MISNVNVEKLSNGKARSGAKRGAAPARTEFLNLLTPHLDGLYAMAMRLTRSQTEAEELVQEATTKSYQHLSSFEKGTNFQAWVYRILVNAFLTSKRSSKKAPHALADEDQVAARETTPQPTPQEWPEASELVSDEVKHAIDELPDTFRVPLLLATLGEMQYQEIAEILNVPVGTVMSRIHRARTRLKTELKDYAKDFGWVGKRARLTSRN